MDTAGYLASVFVGIALGILGGGGSILTVPVLVYLFNIDAVLATTYSLFIVGSTSVVGSISYIRKGLTDLKIAFLFGAPSIAAIFLTRIYLLPHIPQEIFTLGRFTLTKQMFLMLFFSITMIAASYSMIRKNTAAEKSADVNKKANTMRAQIYGIIVGAITGLIGAGGGFLIIPVLVNILNLNIKKAVGTSLIIIAVNSLLGFLFSLNHIPIKWSFLLTIVSITIFGILLGSFLSAKLNSKNLKPAFGWFILLMGLYIILKETIIK